ncbi:hypothetical protein [Cedecea sp. P7760]|uniref:hypothetical protein n=1 Tax=Cedecea sp. P7760 TaxID=2726983 RepID=UPI0015A2B7A5|nr:hypothetical protein [Cedecea sp. P7760]NWC63949.1 hypothetical protein [Cedecea sp. P7760]
MKINKQEQLFIRIISLLDNAEMGERRETILHLMHSARRASSDRDDFSAYKHSLNALSQLRKARHSMRLGGASEQNITLLESAIDMLLPVQKEAESYSYISTVVSSRGFLYLLFALLLLAICPIVFWVLRG